VARNGWPKLSARPREGHATVPCLNSSSIFATVEQHFTNLTAHLREPLTLPLTDPASLDIRHLALPEARTVARDITAPLGQRDQIWTELVLRSRRTPEPWRLAAVWMMLPGLKSATYRISRTTRLDVADLRSAVITGFLEALATIDPAREDLGSALYWSAYNAGRAACRPDRHVDPTDEIDRIAAYITETPPPVHNSIVAATGHSHPTRRQLEGERLGSIAHRVGVTDRLHHPALCQRRATHRGTRVHTIGSRVRNIANVPAHPADHSAERR
jgi:hypothetical protein